MAYWRKIKAFETSLEQSKGKPAYTFYDGPPFATGLPHYGHILAGTIKDVVTRYAHQTGYHVERRFGWDCHGLPVEYEIDKKLKISGRQEVLNMGIDKYNGECRSIVQRYTKEWQDVVERFGRWIDFENDYKTMDRDFMESVWWVFKTLFDKGQVYRAFRVMPYSTACNTPLSNFEVALNYKEVADPSVVVKAKARKGDEFFLIWTTTPWTLPSNLAIAVNPAFTYLRVTDKKSGEKWVLGKDRYAWLLSQTKREEKDMVVNAEVLGKDLAGLEYEPIFPYFVDTHPYPKKAWRILLADYVTAENGTCMVHQAPAFGDDDYQVCLKNGIILKTGEGLVCPVDENGNFTAVVKDFQGLHVKAADDPIRKHLKERNVLLVNNSEVHNYPFCWRSDTPLIYRATPSWFVKVEEIRDRLIKNNNISRWVPEHVQTGRFHNWLAEARDWCVSRSRYWGTPIPLWVSSDFEEMVCVGSVEELEKYAGRKIPDIHRHCIDDITIPSKKGKGVLRRVDEVFDCWFESGSMPYGQQHYPFEKKAEFESKFPANFIAEGLDQTRGWFYTLMVLSTHLFDQPAFKNLIVNGLVLASDGKKMSKRLKNYPDPIDVVNRHGADAVRMYLCNSPVVRAEPLKFKEDGVRDVVKDVFLPWYNAYRFLVQEVGRFEDAGAAFVPSKKVILDSTNVMDKWIYAACQSLIQYVSDELAAYRLYTVVPRLVNFLEELTNWYVRLNRDRMRGSEGEEAAKASLGTLYDVMLDSTILLAPIVPFITETIYQNLSRALPEKDARKAASVHFVMIPKPDQAAMRPDIERAVGRMQQVIALGRIAREKKKVSVKTPLKAMKIMHSDKTFLEDIKMLQAYVKEQLNVVALDFSSDMSSISVVASPNFSVLGKRLGKQMKEVQAACKALTQAQIQAYEKTGAITVAGIDLAAGDLEVKRVGGAAESEDLHLEADSEAVVVLDFTPDEELLELAVGREVVNRVQRLRKNAGLQQGDSVLMFVTCTAAPAKKQKGKEAAAPAPTVEKALQSRRDYVEKLLRRSLQLRPRQGHEVVLAADTWTTDTGEKVEVAITKMAVAIETPALQKLSAEHAAALGQWLASWEPAALEAKGKKATATIAGAQYVLEAGKHFRLPQ